MTLIIDSRELEKKRKVKTTEVCLPNKMNDNYPSISASFY